MGSPDAVFEAAMVEEVASMYGLDIISWQTHDSYYQTDSVVRVTTPGGVYMVKRRSGSATRMTQWLHCMTRLQESGYAFMPRWHRTKDGHWVAHVQGECFYVMDWVQGTWLPRRRVALAELGRALAAMHQQDTPLHVRAQGSDLDAKLNRYFESADSFKAWNGSATDHELENRRWLWRHKDDICGLAEEARERLDPDVLASVEAVEQQRGPLVHGDITRFNVLMTPDGSVKLIDWNGLAGGSAVNELVNALSNTAMFRPRLMEAFLNGYEQVRPLGEAERQVAAALFRFPKEAWYVRQDDAGSSCWNDELLSIVRQTWHERRKAIRWMDAWAETGRGHA